MKLVLLGAPGSGKGTIAQPLSYKLGIPSISTGDIFRQNIRDNTELGKTAKQYIDKGELVPDGLTNRIVEDRIQQPDCKDGFILDGYPRTTEQAIKFDESLAVRNEKLAAVINLNLDDEIIIRRLLLRRVCSKCGQTYNVEYKMPRAEGICDVCGGSVVQRDDDNEETVIKRLETYHTKTQPLVEYYANEGLILHVDNQQGMEKSVAFIMDAISGKIKRENDSL